MAALFLNLNHEMGVASKQGERVNYRKKLISEFLTERGWTSVGNQAFFSTPASRTAKEQLLSQATALEDIEDLVNWKPFLREYLNDAIIIVGQAYSVGSLLENEVSTVKEDKESGNERPISLDLALEKENSGKSGGREKVSTASGHDPKSSKVSQSGLKSKAKSRPPSCPARNRPMGSASKVTSDHPVSSPKTPCKSVKDKRTTCRITTGFNLGDINFNHLSEHGNGLDDSMHMDDMTPLYLGSFNDTEDNSDEDRTRCFYNGYRVETYVKLDSCSKKLYCTNININPSERVVV